MKALQNLERIVVSHDMLQLLLSLYESKGKSFYYNDLFSRDLQAFEKNATEQDVYFLAKVLDLKLTDARMKLLAKKNLVAKNKEETEFNNLKQALTQLHKAPSAFELLVNEVINLSKILSKNLTPIHFKTYEVKEDSILTKSRRINKREDLEKLFNLYEKQLKSRKYELTQLIANFYVDFLNMDVFTDKNEEIGLILLFALLAQHFNAFSYVSFFAYFYPEIKAWKHAVIQAGYHWEAGYAQTDSLSRMLIDLLNKVYLKIDEIAHEYMFEKELNKSDNIENTILKLNELFSKEDIRKKHPNVSDTTIDRTLKRLKEENMIRPIGKGRSSKWQRIVKGNHKFTHEQLKLFND